MVTGKRTHAGPQNGNPYLAGPLIGLQTINHPQEGPLLGPCKLSMPLLTSLSSQITLVSNYCTMMVKTDILESTYLHNIVAS
jgi:hypothetical protein